MLEPEKSLQFQGIKDGTIIDCNLGLKGGMMAPESARLGSYYNANVKFCLRCNRQNVIAAKKCRKRDCGSTKFRILVIKDSTRFRVAVRLNPKERVVLSDLKKN